jgi:putative nucleotidyltransferase with HDIG domain
MSAPDGDRRWRRLLRALFFGPGEEMSTRVVHHGARILLVASLAALVPVFFPRTPLPQFASLEEGEVAGEDVIAEVTFPVVKSPERLEAERREAESGVAPVFVRQPAGTDSAIVRVRRLFTRLDSASGGAPDTAGLRSVLRNVGLDPTPEQLDYLSRPSERAALLEEVVSAYRGFLPYGVAPASDMSRVDADQVMIRGDERDRYVHRDSIFTAGQFYRSAAERFPAEASGVGMEIYHNLLVRFMEPTLRLDPVETRRIRQQARGAVQSTAGYVLEGERIVGAHERVGEADVEELRSYQAELLRRGLGPEEGRVKAWLGGGLYGLTLLGLLAGVLLLFRPAVYHDLRGFVIVLGLTMGVLGIASLVGEFGRPEALVPVAFAVLLVGILYDGLLAFVTAGVVAGLVAVQPGFAGPAAPFLTGVAGAAAALGVRGVRRRADSWIVIALITGGYVAGAGVLSLLEPMGVGEVLSIAAWGGLNAATCTVFAVGAVLPLLESFTGITTEQTLLELSDLNRPLLRRLSREAPGTYAHSVNIANLAEAACAEIGADALRARVGAYYHDIGKLARPQYFIENQPPGRNPHDRLEPRTSARVIVSHVGDGLEMAEEARLPEALQSVIREHHGTMTVAYFLEKARLRENGSVDPDAFRYPGPRPRSRESAVVMLADGVEAACRTLTDPSTERIRELVAGVVRARRDDGQLDESPLTLKDLDLVRRQFVRVLEGMYHRRIDYPETLSPGQAEPAPSVQKTVRRVATDVPTDGE